MTRLLASNFGGIGVINSITTCKRRLFTGLSKDTREVSHMKMMICDLGEVQGLRKGVCIFKV